MKSIRLLILLLFSTTLLFTQNLKPYILAIESSEPISALKGAIQTNLEAQGISVAGQYQPAGDNNRWILVVTSPELQHAVREVGGLTGFAAALRIAITRENGVSKVTYTNPAYWGNAYFRGDSGKVAADYTAFDGKLKTALSATGTYVGSAFGSKKGLSPAQLQKYHYMMGMPYFDDTEILKSFGSYQEAINKIETSIKQGVPDVKLVYKVTISGKNLTLYGFALSGDDGEATFLPVIDIGTPKHTAFLPYELLVTNNEVHMLHGRYRIALSFPDLTMGTFTKIMSTPGNIEDLLKQVVQ